MYRLVYFVAYYNQNAASFFAGCGSGRDSRAFKEHGFSVAAFDASSEMCRMASQLAQIDVLQMKFDEIAFEDEFDGIWACASLLHVPFAELPEILGKLHKAMKAVGTLYVSFEYGEGPKQRGERTFSDFTEETVKVLPENRQLLRTPIVRNGRLATVGYQPDVWKGWL